MIPGRNHLEGSIKFKKHDAPKKDRTEGGDGRDSLG